MKHTLIGRDDEGRDVRHLVLHNSFEAHRTAAGWRDDDHLRVTVTPPIPEAVRTALRGAA